MRRIIAFTLNMLLLMIGIAFAIGWILLFFELLQALPQFINIKSLMKSDLLFFFKIIIFILSGLIFGAIIVCWVFLGMWLFGKIFQGGGWILEKIKMDSWGDD